MARKRRSDRNHAVYQIVCRPTGERYIGLTVVRGRAFQKSVKIRWDGHIHHAIVEGRDYPLQRRIREFGPDAFDHELIQVVRGKQPAHDLEKSLITTLQPELNVECTSRKKNVKQTVA